MAQDEFKHSIFNRFDSNISQFEETLNQLSKDIESNSNLRKSHFILTQLQQEIQKVRNEAEATLNRLNTFGATLDVMSHPEIGVEPILQEVLTWYMTLTGCERGFVSLYDPQEEAFMLSVSEQWIDHDLRPMEHTISETVLQEVQKSHNIFTSSNMDMASSSYQKSGSWRVPLRTILGIPLIWREELMGVFYGDKKITSGAVARDMIPLFKIFSAQAAIAIRNAQLFANLSNLD